MDYYELLSVPRNAPIQEIDRAYRKLAWSLHPDRNIGDEAACEKFKQVQEAYETLSNVQKRHIYDARLPKRRKGKTKNKETPSWKESRPHRESFVIADAPPPKFDLWGKPQQKPHKWVDTYADSYEGFGQPDIRG